jgi:hypothetical protein
MLKNSTIGQSIFSEKQAFLGRALRRLEGSILMALITSRERF